METIVPIRKIETFQTDSGKKIEVHTKISEQIEDINPEEKENINNKNIIYLMVLQAQTPIGLQEIRYEILADSIEQAFIKFDEESKNLINNMENTITEASADDLQMLDQMGNNPRLII